MYISLYIYIFIALRAAGCLPGTLASHTAQSSTCTLVISKSLFPPAIPYCQKCDTYVCLFERQFIWNSLVGPWV